MWKLLDSKVDDDGKNKREKQVILFILMAEKSIYLYYIRKKKTKPLLL